MSQENEVDRCPSMTPAELCVFVVDDDPTQCTLSVEVLSEAGMCARSFAKPADALAAARTFRPDAILSDVLMDDIDGFTFCRTVRNDAELAGVPVVLVTARFLEPIDRELARAVGADALVERTPDLAREIAALRSSVRQPRAARPNTPSLRAVSDMYARSVTTQLNRVQHDARINAIKYKTLFENATDALSVVDPSGILLDANKRWEELLQRTREQILGQHIRAFAASGHERVNDAIYDQAFGNRRSDAQVVALARQDGKTIYVELSTVNVDLDGREVMFAIGRDVTDAIETTRKLTASEQRYRSLLESIPDVVWSTEPDGTLLFVSPNCERMTGFTPEQVSAGHDTRRFGEVHPEDLQKLDTAFRALVDDGETMDIEYRRRHKNGSWIWIHNRASAVRDEQGQILRIDGIFHDVSEHRRLEEQLRRSQKLEAVGQLTGGVAHDFNNILAVILANTHFVLEGLPAGDPRREDAEQIKHAAERAAALTRQLLAFSRQQVLAPVDLDLDDLIEGVHKMLRRVISEDIELIVERAKLPGIVHADPGQIEQVVMNLCVNARDAMPDGGSLRISTQSVDVDAARHADATDSTRVPDGRYVCLSICDTGSGMDHATKQRIFEPFFTTKGPGKGTGLGLSTCYGIVKQSGGFIEVESGLGVGTTFHVYLPCVQHAEASPRPSALAPAILQGDETILLVEDDQGLCSSLARALGASGYTVHEMHSGTDALRHVAEHPGTIDLVLSDVVLADGNGISLVEQIRELSPEIKTMLMSGYTDHARLDQRQLRAGAAFLQKPFAPIDLVSNVRKVLDARATPVLRSHPAARTRDAVSR